MKLTASWISTEWTNKQIITSIIIIVETEPIRTKWFLSKTLTGFSLTIYRQQFNSNWFSFNHLKDWWISQRSTFQSCSVNIIWIDECVINSIVSWNFSKFFNWLNSDIWWTHIFGEPHEIQLHHRFFLCAHFKIFFIQKLIDSFIN